MRTLSVVSSRRDRHQSGGKARVINGTIAVLTAFFATGQVGRSREQAAQVLRQRSAELRRQWERTARMAVLAERGRVAAWPGRDAARRDRPHLRGCRRGASRA
jgi:hypothetical protein